MIRRVQSLLSILVVASATMFGGCVVETTSDDAPSEALDELIDHNADGTPSFQEPAEQGSATQIESPILVTRGAPASASKDWASGESRPIPWHQSSTSAAGTGTAAADEDGDSPPVSPPVKNPGGGR